LALPVFVRITLCGVALLVFTIWLPKFRVVVDRLAPGLTPVPLTLTVCGLPVALSETLKTPLVVLLVAGVYVTLMVQVDAAATLDPQVLVWANPAPVTLMLEMVSVPEPELVSVTV
jgi:hypothetical protein